MPIGNDGERKTTLEKGCEVPHHRQSLAGIGRSGVVDADEEVAHGYGFEAPAIIGGVAWTPPYRRSRAAKA